MASDVAHDSPQLDERPKAQAAPVLRTAFYLSSRGAPLFAWLHTHAEEPSYDHAVVICPPLGHEQLHAHRSLRHLADDLARRHIPVLRFDWHGTGDSAGDDGESNRVATWIENVDDALQWVQQTLGCHRVSVVGLRMGATLVADALAEHEIENFVLWAPVAGRFYVREMKLIDRAGEAASAETSQAIQAGGFRMNAETAEELSKLKPACSKPRCHRALVVSRDDLPTDDLLTAHLASLGIAVDQVEVPGFAAMMTEPHRSQVPHVAIQTIVNWLDAHISAEGLPSLTMDPDHLGPDSVTMTVGGDAASQEPIVRETAWRLTSDPDLFGIVSEPTTSPKRNLPTIVLLNAGSSYRIGPSRLNVYLARHFALHGFRTLRLDVSGLGDSVLDDTTKENDCYSATAFRDIQHALDALEKRDGLRRIVLMGLCSGAYAAFQSAAQFSTPLLIESVLINPLTFYWNDSMQVDDVMSQQRLADHYSMSSATDWRKWAKFLTGQTRLTFFGAARLVVNRITQKLGALLKRRSDVECDDRQEPSHPQVDDLAADLERVERRERRLAMFVSSGDPGCVILKHHANQQAQQMLESGSLRVEFISDADHTFSRLAMRHRVRDALVAYLNERFG